MLTPIGPFSSVAGHDTIPNRQGKGGFGSNLTELSANRTKSTPSGLARNRDSFTLFNNILQKAYQKMAFSPSSQSTLENGSIDQSKNLKAPNINQYQKVDKISSQQASDTILNFISQKLKSDEANGANKEALLERLEQGLAGFVKGFNEAKDQIEGMGLLTPSLSDEINETYERVTQGIEQLRAGITGESSNQTVTDVSRVTLAGEASESRSFSLELTTRDGDRVVIDISRAQQSSFGVNSTNSSSGSSLSVEQQNSSTSQFNLNVTGELDDDELTAINQLLQDVDKIAGEFFGGNLDAAFEHALDLTMDREELASLNLQLQKTTTVKALAAYETTAQTSPGDPKSHSVSPIIEVSNLLENIEDLLAEARKFAAPLQLLTEITEGVSGLVNQDSVAQKSNDLAEMLNALVSKFEL